MRLIQELLMFGAIVVVLAGPPSLVAAVVLRHAAPERWPKVWLLLCVAVGVWGTMAIITAHSHYDRTMIARAANDHYMIWVSYLPWLVFFAPSIPALTTLLIYRPKPNAKRKGKTDPN